MQRISGNLYGRIIDKLKLYKNVIDYKLILPLHVIRIR